MTDHSNPSDASYPLDIDLYLATSAPGEAEINLGSDSYPASSASIFRSVAIQPCSANDPAGLLIATATDAVVNTSELSRQWVPVPEPCADALLLAGIG